jgi:hypothetical protein
MRRTDPRRDRALPTVATAKGAEVEQDGNNGSASVPQPASPFTDRRRFLMWALSIGAVPPERVVERIVAELEQEGAA